MKLFYLLNGLLFLGIFFFLVVRLFRHYQDKNVYRIMKLFFISSVGALSISLISFLWFFDVLDYVATDFVMIFGVFLVVLSFVFFRVVFLFTNNKRLNYFLGLYIVSIVTLLLMRSEVALFLISSCLFLILIFMEFVLRGDAYRKVGYLGFLFSVVSLIFSLFLFLGMEFASVFIFVSGLALFWLFYVFVVDLKKYAILPPKYDHERGYLFVLFGHLIFVIAFVNFIFIGTIGVHEVGHYGVSQFFDCEGGRIIYENSLFHTEAVCGSEESIFYVTLGGVILPLLIAGMLFLLRGKFFREVALMVVGFNLASISRDLRAIFVSENFIVLALILGILFVVLGVFLIARSRIDNEIYEGGLDSFSPIHN